MELMELTDLYGQRCLVNPTQVLIARKAIESDVRAMLVMAHNWAGDNQLFVEESLDEVAVKWARAMRVEEME